MGGRSRIAFGIAAVVLAACGSGTPAATSGPTTSATAAPTLLTAATPRATGAPQATAAPATYTLTVAGDPKVTGAWITGGGINCNNPTLAGTNILTFAQSPDGQATLVLTFTPGLVNVSERAGSGSAYTAREFKGTGVSGFDPARGVTFDSDVEIVPITTSAGTLGTITHVSGSVDCGGQTTGTSTVVASGSSAEGAITGPFTQFRIVCNSSAADGNTANIIAVIDTVTPRTYFIVGLPSNGNATMFTIAATTPQQQHSYVRDTAGKNTYTVTATGLHLDADFIEVLAQGATDAPHVIHLEGDATCGVFNKI